ncbi:MAG: hypothetical protein M3Q97_04035 [Bacteroidota bacterium]|nr:hypothetical protein [Bacteroidota bacterium]
MGQPRDTNEEQSEIRDFHHPDHDKAKVNPEKDGDGRINSKSISGNTTDDETIENDGGALGRNNAGDKSAR